MMDFKVSSLLYIYLMKKIKFHIFIASLFDRLVKVLKSVLGVVSAHITVPLTVLYLFLAPLAVIASIFFIAIILTNNSSMNNTQLLLLAVLIITFVALLHIGAKK